MARRKTAAAPAEDEYPERPLEEALADPEEIAAIENRPDVDQIADYHEVHRTLQSEAPAEAPEDAQG